MRSFPSKQGRLGRCRDRHARTRRDGQNTSSTVIRIHESPHQSAGLGKRAVQDCVSKGTICRKIQFCSLADVKRSQRGECSKDPMFGRWWPSHGASILAVPPADRKLDVRCLFPSPESMSTISARETSTCCWRSSRCATASATRGSMHIRCDRAAFLPPSSIDNAESAKPGRQAGQRTRIPRITTVAIHRPICQRRLSLSRLAMFSSRFAMSSRNCTNPASIRDCIASISARTAALSPFNSAMARALPRSSLMQSN